MALQGFNEAYYLNEKLTDLQAVHSEWVGKDAAFLKTVLASYGLTPEQHYLQVGYSEGNAPNAFFNAAEYTAAKVAALFATGTYATEDLAEAAFLSALNGTDVYQHYLAAGAAEGLNPSNAFDESTYFTDKLANLTAAGTLPEGVTDVDSLRAWFASNDLTALGHYEMIGGDANTEGIQATAVPAAEQVNVSTPTSNPGTTVAMTTGIDTLVGTDGDDLFVGSFDSLATSTSNLGDTIDGGKGNDTVRITSNAANTVIPTLTNVENLHLIDTVHESLNVAGIAGLTSLELDSGTATVAAAADITITVAAGQTLTLDSITDASAGAVDVANQEGIDIASAASVASLSLNLDGVGTGGDLDLDVTGNGVATVNIESTGGNAIALANTGGAIKTLNVSGAGSTTFSAPAALAPTTITTFNAGDATGAVSVDLSTQAGASQAITGGEAGDTLTVDLSKNITLDAGKGNDVVTLANPTAANLSSATGAADKIAGGDGTDTLALTAAGAAALAGDTAADRAVISGFEQLRATTDLTGQTFDISNLGMNYLQVGSDVTGAATVNGFTSGATIEFRDGDSVVGGTQAAVNVGMTGATAAGTPDDTLNIVLNDNLVNQAAANNAVEAEVGVSGINKLNISTADRSNADGATTVDDGYSLVLANDNNVDTMTITGTRELSFTSTASTAALATVDASGLSGDLSLNLTTNGLTQGATVTGGSGTNTITGTAFGDVITGGALADTITTGNGADTITGGAGADTFVFGVGSTGGAPSSTVFDTITDFGKTSDIIDVIVGLSVEQNGAAVAGTAFINSEGIATFDAADDTLAERIAAVENGLAAGGVAAGAFSVFESDADSYVFVADGVAGIGANDLLIKLAGVTGLSDTTITGGDLTIA